MRTELRGVIKQAFLNLYRNVTTSSSLVTVFNTKPSKIRSISFSKDDKTGIFGMDELRSSNGFYLLKEQATHVADSLILETQSPNRKRKMVDIFDELSDSLCRVADLAEFIRLAHPSKKYSQSAENACIAVSGVVEKLNTNKSLYQSLKNVLETEQMTESEKHVASLFLFDFEQCGIHLPDHERFEVVQLNEYILHLGQRFMAGSVTGRVVPKTSVSQSIRNLLTTNDGEVTVNGLYSDSNDEWLREAAYRIFLLPSDSQMYLLNELLSSRYKLAKLCGFETHAHRVLKASLVETPERVQEFLNALSKQLWPRAEIDFKIMTDMKKAENPICRPLAAWDVPYYTLKAKRESMKLADSKDFAPYFSLGYCMEGLSNLMNSLFRIRLENVPLRYGEVWSGDVYKLAVVHEYEGVLGHIFCDFYERNGKPNQDCHFTIRGGRRLADGTYQDPIVVVMLSFPAPGWGRPTLLSPNMVDNLFHEMGHAMHSMLGRTQHQHVTGTRCSTDLAEVPSILMEYFASDPRVLKTFAKHYQTNEPLPDDMIHRLCCSKHMFSASEMQVQLFYSMLDQEYHKKYPLDGGTTTDVLAQTQQKYYCIPYVANTAWQLRFSHLVGYGAKYYSYLMSRAVASWIWHTFFKQDPFCSSAGERYRRECLAHGGGKPARQLIGDFLRLEVTPSALSNALIQDLETNQNLYRNINLKTQPPKI